MSDEPKPAKTIVIAVLVENHEFTGGGMAAAIFMVVAALLAAFFAVLVPSNAIQQAIAALVGLLVIVPLGFGAVIGRTRSYKVFRELRPDERV